MTTELHLIHTIHDIVRGGEVNNDDPINERLMRAFLSAHRGRILERKYRQGETLPEEVFQPISNPVFINQNGKYIAYALPKMIRFSRGNFGMIAYKNDYTISIMDSEDYHLAAKNKFNKYHPRIKFLGDKMELFLGSEHLDPMYDDLSDSALNRAVRALNDESRTNTISIGVDAILVNPDNGLGYDWTKSPYPLTDELIEDIMNSVNAREFNIFLRTKSDETGDLQSQTDVNPQTEL